MTQPYVKIRVLIADDHEMVREGLQVIATKIPEFEIVAEAVDGEQLVQLCKAYVPDVVLTDVKMPKMNGIEATRAIKKEFPQIGVIALSSFDEESLIMDMLQAGAKGYLLKNASKQDLTEAVKAAYRDETYYCRQTNVKLSEMIARGGFSSQANAAEKLFTARELQVIEMICKQMPSKQIAAALNLRTRTIERYRDSIMDKMNVNNVAGVVMYAMKHGLYRDSPKT
jgi:DNA-binding NarL/FixJ family response regulator